MILAIRTVEVFSERINKRGLGIILTLRGQFSELLVIEQKIN